MYGGILYWTDLSMSSFVTVLYPWHCKPVNIHTLLSLFSLLPCCPLKSGRKWEEEEHPALGDMLYFKVWHGSHIYPAPLSHGHCDISIMIFWVRVSCIFGILGQVPLCSIDSPLRLSPQRRGIEVMDVMTGHYSQYVYHIKVICQRNDVHKVFLCYSVNLFLGHNMIWLPWDRWFSLLLPLWSKGCNRTEGVLMSSQSPHINHLI